MKTRITGHLVKVCGLATAILAATPAMAFAEEEEASSGIALLIPKLAELIPAIIAFSIIFLVLSKLVWPSVMKMMDDREQAIQGEFLAATAAKEEAEKAVEESAQIIADARKQADGIISKAKDEADAERNRILVEAHTQAAATIDQGHKVVETERTRAMNDLSRSVVDLSVEIAGKIIGNNLDEDQHRALAEHLLDEMGKDHA